MFDVENSFRATMGEPAVATARCGAKLKKTLGGGTPDAQTLKALSDALNRARADAG